MIKNLKLKDVLASKNIRRTVDKNADTSLKESIRHHGLLENLIVQQREEKYYLVAGYRRYRALQYLTKDKHLKTTHTFPCLVIAPEAKPEEIALAENEMRSSMHPADQAIVFYDLHKKQGVSISDIAARFGINERTVKQRNAIGNVSPKILDLYRNSELSYDAVKAFTIVPEHKRQFQIYGAIKNQTYSGDVSPYMIKQYAQEQIIKHTDPRVLFVGFDNYQKAGGFGIVDLFADTDDLYVTNKELLDKLTLDKLKLYKEKLDDRFTTVNAVIDPDSIKPSDYVSVKPAGSNIAKQEKIAMNDIFDKWSEVFNGYVTPEHMIEETFNKYRAALDGINDLLIDEFNGFEFEEFIYKNATVFLFHNNTGMVTIKPLLHLEAQRKYREEQAEATRKRAEEAKAEAARRAKESAPADEKVVEVTQSEVNGQTVTKTTYEKSDGTRYSVEKGMVVPGVNYHGTDPTNNQDSSHTEETQAKAGISQKFTSILEHLRNNIIKSNLAFQPGICFDLLVWTIFTQVSLRLTSRMSSQSIAINVTKSATEPYGIDDKEMKELDNINPAKAQLKEFEDAIDLKPVDDIDPDNMLTRFRKFVELPMETKNAMMSFAVSQSIQPITLDFLNKEYTQRYNPIHHYLVNKLNIDWREDLVLNNRFFNYYSKADLLHIGATITEDKEWAVQNAKLKKSELIEALVKIIDPDTISSAVNEDSKKRAITWLPEGFPAPKENEPVIDDKKSTSIKAKRSEKTKQSRRTKPRTAQKSTNTPTTDSGQNGATPPIPDKDEQAPETLPAFLS